MNSTLLRPTLKMSMDLSIFRRHEPGDGMAMPRDNHGFTPLYLIEQLGKVGFGRGSLYLADFRLDRLIKPVQYPSSLGLLSSGIWDGGRCLAGLCNWPRLRRKRRNKAVI